MAAAESLFHKDYLEYEETHDHLTGLYNGDFFMDQLSNTIDQMPGQFGIMITDLDGLKGINDTYGHLAGDQQIRYSADTFKAFQEEIRHGEIGDREEGLDIVARLHGDEFAFQFPGVKNNEDLRAIRKRLYEKANEAGIRASLGIALHEEGMDEHVILSAAGESLRQEKNQRKLELYSGSVGVIEHIGALAAEHNIDIRDIPAVLDALKELHRNS